MTETLHPPQAPHPPSPDRRRWVPAVLAAAAVAVALIVALVLVTDDDADVASDTTTTAVTTPTTEEPAPSTTASTAPTTEPTTAPTTTPGGITSEEAATVAWPAPGDGSEDGPAELAARFATDVLGFDDPVVGAFQEGDSRSGELEVRPAEEGPVTTVGVRRMSDQRLYVVFAATSEVELLLPTAGSAIDHPLQVEGWGRGFEGQIRIAVVDRSTSEELGHGFATAGGTGDLAPFATEVAWDNPGGGWGLVVATVGDGEDGTTWAGAALPVGFIGGD